MRKFFACLSVAAMLLVTPFYVCSSQAADPNRQEVENRLELNNVTAEELAKTGAVPLDTAKKIIELREQLGSFQSYDDLGELDIPKDQMEKLQWNTTIQGIASDCNC